MVQVYKSKIDLWLGAVLWVAIVLCFIPLLSAIPSGTPGEILMAVITMLVGAGIPLWLIANTRYILSDTDLLIKSGPFRWRLALGDIHNISPTRNPFSSPALSLDRLKIDYGHYQSVMISPKNKTEFLQDLEARRLRFIAGN